MDVDGPSDRYFYLDDDLIYSAKEHAEITFKYIASQDERHLDLVFESNGKKIARANRLIVAAFSSSIEQALLKAYNGSVTLEIDPEATGISEETFLLLLNYMYTGKFRISPELHHAAFCFGCSVLKELLRSAMVEHDEVQDEWHATRFQEQLCRFRKESKFLDCNIVTGRLGVVRCHRLLMCAHSGHLATALTETLNSGTVTLRIDSHNVHISTEDLKMIVDFAYSGELYVGQKRFRMLRVSAFDLSMSNLVDLIDYKMRKIKDEEEQLLNNGPEDLEEMEYSNQIIDQNFTRRCQRGVSNDDEDQSISTSSVEDIFAQTAKEYNSIYEEYVLGPRRGRKPSRSLKRPVLNKYQPVVVKNSTTISLSDANSDVTTIPALTLSVIQESERKESDVDSFGYGLPEIVGASDVTVPLVVGDQREMMEKPFKCPYCEHRAKAKSGLEKHIRCIHTGETPYKCNICGHPFKVQSNLVRHIRRHTGEKPYACKKCGMCYADKRNMDAHIYRKHLKMHELECTFPGCRSRFWRQDRFVLHCLKIHGSEPQSFK